MKYKIAVSRFFSAAALFLACVQPQNPFINPNNAVIQADKSLGVLKDTLETSTQYACSVSIYLPNLVDSFFVKSGDSTLFKGAVDSVSPIVFPFTPAKTGAYQVRFVIVKANGSKDSLVKSGYVTAAVSLAPIITPVSSKASIFLGDSVIVKFILVDPDSDLVGYTTRFSSDLDTALSHAVDFQYSITSRVGYDTIARKVSGNLLFQGITAPLICFAQAIDRKNNYSNVAACTVFVADTEHPTITKVRPLFDSIFILPDTITVTVTDPWGVDSVKLNGEKMALAGSPALYTYVVPALALGESFDTVTAWNKAGNAASTIFPRIYSGPKVYPPVVKNLGRTIFTGSRFDTLFLDTCAIPSNPSVSAIAAYQDSLLWQIVDSAGTSLPIPGTKKFVVPVPADTTWTGSITLRFLAVSSTGPSTPVTEKFTVQNRPGTPIITLGNKTKLLGSSFDTLFLDTCATDSIDASSTLNWTIKNGKYFKADSLLQCPVCVHPPCILCINPSFRRRVAIVPDTTKINPATWTGSDTLRFSVKSPEGITVTKPIVFTKWTFIIPIIINPVTLPKKQ